MRYLNLSQSCPILLANHGPSLNCHNGAAMRCEVSFANHPAIIHHVNKPHASYVSSLLPGDVQFALEEALPEHAREAPL